MQHLNPRRLDKLLENPTYLLHFQRYLYQLYIFYQRHHEMIMRKRWFYRHQLPSTRNHPCFYVCNYVWRYDAFALKFKWFVPSLDSKNWEDFLSQQKKKKNFSTSLLEKLPVVTSKQLLVVKSFDNYCDIGNQIHRQ